MSLAIANITVDCRNAAALADFWARLLELEVDPDPNPYFATVGRAAGMSPILMFIQVPDKTPGKNVVHLDLSAADWREHIDRAIALGAQHIGDFEEHGGRWTTLADPEGNLFDIGAS
ncbi:VOC family protein [Nocardia puris]|uniref:VOC family protein n=1 Tax=Nocardia puris TaxID=208602 RepID=UPI00189491BC|nr:VOC family protein [Nocardia puris]MBF6213876.1 VOC family protein [Nocardia puris]MBF6368515.1 VOC family protein [Nocardia puris]MBF6463002.1 VOC family protein [Nocardia puris]